MLDTGEPGDRPEQSRGGCQPQLSLGASGAG